MKSDELPLVSVVVPSYNQGQFIEDTLKSILGQHYPRIEIIVVDGASTDGTLSVLKRYRDRITFISEPDNGQSEAINKGFRMANGDIVAWLNSDDIYPVRAAVGQMVDAFHRWPYADLIYGDFIEIDTNNRVVKYHRRPAFSIKRLLRVGYISQPATFFRRRVIERMSICEDLQYAMDLEYWLRAYKFGFLIKHVRFPIAGERLHSEAKCVKATADMADEAWSIRKEYGANLTITYRALRCFDRLFLYLTRLPAVLKLINYRRASGCLTVRLHFDGAIKRTLAIGVREAS